MGGLLTGYPFAPPVDGLAEGEHVSWVVVHYRGEQDLQACLRSLYAQPQPVEVVVVDNGSGDGAVQRLPPPPAPHRLRRLLRLRNGGFAAGVNAGLALATGRWIGLLNPDAALLPGAQGLLLDELRAGADAAAPQILLADDPALRDNAGHALLPDGLNWCRGRGEPARDGAPEDLLLFSGAAVLLRREALAAAGGLDPSYFAYGEDADLALRMGRLGLRCRYVPAARVVHRVGGSFGRFAWRKVYLVERNRLRVAVTHLPVSWLLASPAWTLARHLRLARAARRGEGLAAAWAPGARLALPLVVGAAHAASILALPCSLRRRVALRRWAGAGGSWRGQLDGARVGLDVLDRRGPRA